MRFQKVRERCGRRCVLALRCMRLKRWRLRGWIVGALFTFNTVANGPRLPWIMGGPLEASLG